MGVVFNSFALSRVLDSYYTTYYKVYSEKNLHFFIIKIIMGVEWKHGICGCSHDLGICCCGIFLPCCLTYQNAENLGKSGPLYFLLGFITPCIHIFLLRSEAREQYGIEGSIVGDVACSVCCQPFVQCQTANEILDR